MVRTEPTNNRTAGIDTNHSTMFTLLLELNVICQGRIQPASLREAISVIFGSQVSVGSQVSFRIVQNHGEKSYFRRC